MNKKYQYKEPLKSINCLRSVKTYLILGLLLPIGFVAQMAVIGPSGSEGYTSGASSDNNNTDKAFQPQLNAKKAEPVSKLQTDSYTPATSHPPPTPEPESASNNKKPNNSAKLEPSQKQKPRKKCVLAQLICY